MRSPLSLVLLAPLALALGGCLSPGPAPMDTESGSSTSDGSDSTSSTTISTTTMSSTTGETETGLTTTGGGECGDGKLDAGEECDDGDNNADDAACTSTCKNATCGDGLVQSGAEECDDGAENADTKACTAECKDNVCGDGKLLEGVEICDDGVNDGAYEGCMPNCAQLGPYCGDGFLQEEHEECDSLDLTSGCLSTCAMAKSCLEIKNDTNEAQTGIYTIQPEGVEPLQAWCEMDADGGGYTLIKVGSQTSVYAPAAEAACAAYGMKVFAPRSSEHLVATYNFATAENLEPLVVNTVKASVEYLWIIGVYAVMPGISCFEKPFNSADCPEWQANDGGTFWITDQVVIGAPKATACTNCSAIYDWNPDGTLMDMAVAGMGGSSNTFLCDIGDK
ncbi:MAG: hypothetical protein H6710_05045 [Myxococcales bacterium]|nr:hypothetical protein [Myxococcales bacterium]